MTDQNKELPLIKLFGNPEENFYSLGKKDAEGYILIQDQITKLCMRSEYTAKLIKKVTEISTHYIKKGSLKLEPELKAYAEGLEKPYSDVLFTFLLPEMVASFNKWMPHLLSIIPGCSSLFVWDGKNKSPIHGRILDYSLAGPFEEYERAIHYNFAKRLQSFSYSTVGMPFPSLSTMNEKGLTLALHYKHGDYFDITGQSIFSLMYQLSSYCTNISEVKKYLKQNPSMSHWGINCSDGNGEVASFDIRGAEVYSEKFSLQENKFLYFNNRPLITSVEDKKLQPFGNKDQCLMRKDFVFNKMKSFDFDAKNLSLEVLKTLTQVKSKKGKDAKNWKLSSLTPSSIQAIVFTPKDFSSLYIPGPSPKIFKNEYLQFNDIISHPTQKLITGKKPEDTNYVKGIELIARTQTAMDSGLTEKAYHCLQMAILKLEGYPEAYIATFYFNVWQYMYEDSTKDMSYIYKNFESLKGKLPSYLEDHRILFLSRLSKILDFGEDKSLRGKIKNENLLEIYNKELKMKPMAIKFVRKLIVPRIEILDIVYIYA
jgi:hypothetical protein